MNMNQSPLRDKRTIQRLKLYNRYDMFKIDVAIIIAAILSAILFIWGFPA